MFKAKDQIIYIPRHAEGNINHPDVEFGFVMTGGLDYVFCRYWIKGQPGVLRTTSCSERTPVSCLHRYNKCLSGEIDQVYAGIEKETMG